MLLLELQESHILVIWIWKSHKHTASNFMRISSSLVSRLSSCGAGTTTSCGPDERRCPCASREAGIVALWRAEGRAGGLCTGGVAARLTDVEVDAEADIAEAGFGALDLTTGGVAVCRAPFWGRMVEVVAGTLCTGWGLVCGGCGARWT